MISGVIFDLDDTLYNELDYVKQAFRHVSNYIENRFHIDSDITYGECMKYLEAEGRGKIFNHIIEDNRLDEDIRTLVDIYRSTKPQLKVYDDARNTISSLKNCGVKLGIITDGCRTVQHNKINGLNIRDEFDEIIVTDDYENAAKPSTIPYEMIIRKWNVEPSECLYIGDNPRKDFVGARLAGVHTIRIIREMGDNMKLKAEAGYEADKDIYSLEEILQYV